jgi:hypothetical protein
VKKRNQQSGPAQPRPIPAMTPAEHSAWIRELHAKRAQERGQTPKNAPIVSAPKPATKPALRITPAAVVAPSVVVPASVTPSPDDQDKTS